MKHVSRIVYTMTILCLLVTLFIPERAVQANNEPPAGAFAGGKGTSGEPYLIQNEKQLKAVQTYPTFFYKLTQDIDIPYAWGPNDTWVPIGTSSQPFTGHFDGAGHTISEATVYLEKSDASAAIGFFGVVKGGTIQQLQLKDMKVVGPKQVCENRTNVVGALIGEAQQATVQEVAITQATIDTECDFVRGALIGRAQETTVQNVSLENTPPPVALIGQAEASRFENIALRKEGLSLFGKNSGTGNVRQNVIVNSSSDDEKKQLPSQYWTFYSRYDLSSSDEGLQPFLTRFRPLSKNTELSFVQVGNKVIKKDRDHRVHPLTATIWGQQTNVNVKILADTLFSKVSINNSADKYYGNQATIDFPASQTTMDVLGRITAENGDMRGWGLKLIRKPATADLEKLNIGSKLVTLKSDQTDYSVDIPETAKEIAFVAETVDADATIEASLNGQPLASLKESLQLAQGDNVLELRITSSVDNVQKTYKITLKRSPVEYSVTSIITNRGTWSTPFTEATKAYEITVEPEVTNVNFIVNTKNPAARINHQANMSGQPFGFQLKDKEPTEVKLTVSAPNSDDSQTFTFTIKRSTKPEPKPQDMTLTSLRLAQAGLSPAFNPNFKTYTAVVDYAVTNVDVLATPASATARVTVTKQPLREGANTVTVTVTAENGQVNVYTIQVIRLGFPIIVDPVVPVIPIVPTPTPQPQPGRVLEPTIQTKVPVSIVRKDEANAKVDEINVPLQQAMTIVNELKRTNQTNVTFPFQDDVTNKADKVRFILPTETLQQLNVADVTFQTPKATVQVPASVVQQYKTALNVTMDMTMPSSVAMPALPAGATIVTPPVDIQYRAIGKVKVTLPVPANSDPATLRVLVQHSQGDNELVRGEVNYNANRLPESVSIWIDRFSIFSVVADSYANVTASIKGEAKEGTTLQAVLSKDVPAAKYQWYHGTTAMNGATKSTYTATAEDANATLTVAITLPNGETIKQSTAVVKAKSCLEKATFGCITPKSAATIYELVNGTAVATTKQVTNATVAQAYLPAAYLLSPDGQWTEQVAGMKYTAISPALVAKVNSGKLVSWQKQLVRKGQIGMVTTTKPQPLFTNGMQRVGYVQMKQNYRVFGTRQALYQIGVNEFVLASEVEFQGK